VRIALVAGLALLAVAIAAVLSRPPLVVAGTDSTPHEAVIAVTGGAAHGCQVNETLPGGTTAMRLWVSVNIGPRVGVTVLSGSRVLTSGAREAGWTGEFVTVPVRRVPHTVSHAKVCLALGAALEKIGLLGASKAHRPAGGPAKMTIEYLRPGSGSWLSRASAVVRRMGLGRSPGGTWISLLPLVLMVVVVLLVALLLAGLLPSARTRAVAPIAGAQEADESEVGRRVALVEPPARARPSPRRGVALGLSAAPRRVPRAAWICALIACLSAASWSIVTPPFQVVDEPSHFAYAQLLAQTGRLPTSGESNYSTAENTVLEDLHHLAIRFNPAVGTISTTAQQRHLEADLAQPLSRSGAGDAGVASAEPPLYYALEAIPSILAAGGNLLDQLTWMRLLSALMAGVSVLFVYLFLREALPAAPWAWTVGALGVALFPLLGFMSGVVNPEAMLCAVSAALFCCLARAFRRGLTPRLAVAIGAVTAVGFLTKLNFVGLVPGIALALIVLTRRAARTSPRTAYRSLAIAATLGAGPVLLYTLVNVLSNHAGLGLASTGIHATGERGSPLDELAYIWQLYLPRLPGMHTDFPGIFPTRGIWFDRTVGLYGWLDTYFPDWVYGIALILAGAIAALCVRALVQRRAALRGRLLELAVYVLIAVGVLGLVGADSYLAFPARAGAYSEPRYLLPLAALFGAALALAARGAGRRFGPVAGVLIVLAILAHDIFSQLLTVARFYY
jgi:hypothetical protein